MTEGEAKDWLMAEFADTLDEDVVIEIEDIAQPPPMRCPGCDAPL